MTADELARLYAEAVPDGTFGGARTRQPKRTGPDPRAAEHREQLLAALRRPATILKEAA